MHRGHRVRNKTTLSEEETIIGEYEAPERNETEEEQKLAQKQKRHRRRMRALRSFLLKLFSLALVLYVLLFHLVGIMTMPNGDMYPRIDAGDLILFYRLERSIKAQDIVVIDKAVNVDFSAVGDDSGKAGDAQETENAGLTTGNLQETENAALAAEVDRGAENAAPSAGNGMAAESEATAEDTANRETAKADVKTAGSAEKADKPWWRKVLTFLKVPDPDEPETTRFVCRVVAAPGDTVEIADGTRLLVNGNSLIETGIFYPTTEYVGFVDYPVTLGADEYFVLADYRNGGADSRFFGPVKLEEIQGVVITIMRRNNL